MKFKIQNLNNNMELPKFYFESVKDLDEAWQLQLTLDYLRGMVEEAEGSCDNLFLGLLESRVNISDFCLYKYIVSNEMDGVMSKDLCNAINDKEDYGDLFTTFANIVLFDGYGVCLEALKKQMVSNINQLFFAMTGALSAYAKRHEAHRLALQDPLQA